MKKGILFPILLISLFFAFYGVCEPAGRPVSAEDAVCSSLFEDYVLRIAKVNGEERCAVNQIIASRGRRNGFWKKVFATLRIGDDSQKMECVDILGRMLEEDATARNRLEGWPKEGPVPAVKPEVYLGDEVISVLMTKSRTAQSAYLPTYLLALARSRRIETKEVLLEFLDKKQASFETHFYAAVGLAQLGDSKGFQWLIDNIIPQMPGVAMPVFNTRPWGADRNPTNWCLAALQQMSNQKNLHTQTEWKSWWANRQSPFVTKRPVQWEIG